MGIYRIYYSKIEPTVDTISHNLQNYIYVFSIRVINE